MSNINHLNIMRLMLLAIKFKESLNYYILSFNDKFFNYNILMIKKFNKIDNGNP